MVEARFSRLYGNERLHQAFGDIEKELHVDKIGM